MNKKFADRHSDDPNSLTTDDRSVLEKEGLTPTDVRGALNDYKSGEAVASGRHFPETGPKLFIGILLVISGLIIGVVTSLSVIGIIVGAIMVIAGVALPFSNFGERRTAA